MSNKQQMNEISLARMIAVSLVRALEMWILDKHRNGLKCFVNIKSALNHASLFRNTTINAKVLFIFLALNVIRTEAATFKSNDCTDNESLPDVQMIDSSRIGFSKNDSRITYSGINNVFSVKKSIDYTKWRPDFCLKYTLRENIDVIDSFTICYKFKKYTEELGSVFGVGFGRSNLADKKILSSITSFFDRSDKSTEIGNRFTITSKNFKKELNIILTYDSAGISTLSNVSDSFNVSIENFDCKKNKQQCKPSYDF